MRVAVISDIHGNALALEAVLTDIRASGADAILNLGDHFAGPLDPGATAEILAGVDMIAIRGNTDRYLVETPDDLLEEDEEAARAMTPQTLDWLRALPATATFEDQVFMSHGAPASDEIYWLDRPKGNVFRTSTIEEIETELPAGKFPLYCCGHTHVARVVTLPDGAIVFNPGSVGRPSFNISEPGSAARAGPEAAYALLTLGGSGWSIDLRQIPYDNKAAAALARANGNAAWEDDLLFGRRR
ncbi:metallophosphoesterase family protein [Pelagibacterium limicola]|uniref:metallophosphoesterase family protein n=1 Tax=Pelagibacterium limicola TaxID=2791022 RepID=UPI0018AF688F|nr:metallophosphoesterase family protein [Pelagibacterium limicola]